MTYVGNDEIVLDVRVGSRYYADCEYESATLYRYQGAEFDRQQATAIGIYPPDFSGSVADQGLPREANYKYRLVVRAYDFVLHEWVEMLWPRQEWEVYSYTTGHVQGTLPRSMIWSGNWTLKKQVTIPDGMTLEMAGATVSSVDQNQQNIVGNGVLNVRGGALYDIHVKGSGTVSIRDAALGGTEGFSMWVHTAQVTLERNTGDCDRYRITIDNPPQFAAVQVADNQLTCDLAIDLDEAGVVFPNVNIVNNHLNRIVVRGSASLPVTSTLVIRGNSLPGVNELRYINGAVSFVDNLDMQRLVAYHVTGATVMGNQAACLQPTDTGIDVGYVANSLFSDNTIRGCRYAFYVYGSAGNTVAGNYAPEGWMQIGSLSAGNTIYNNAFLYRGTVSIDSPNVWNVTPQAGANIVGGDSLGGNFWAGYDAVDGDGDGFLDTPYVLATDNTDFYPLLGSLQFVASLRPVQLNPLDIYFDDATLRYILPVNVVVENAGLEALTNLPVQFSDNGGMNSAQTIAALAPGMTTTLQLDWNITPMLALGKGENDLSLTVTLDPANQLPELIRLNSPHSASIHVDARPAILEINPEYTLAGAYFLTEGSLDNEIEPLVDWNGALSGTGAAPYGKVVFDLNGAVTEESGGSAGASHTYDMAADFNSALTCANNTLRIWAVRETANGDFESEISVIQPTVFPSPAWVTWIAAQTGGDASFEIEPKAPLVEYTFDYQYPEPAFESVWTPPAWIPYLGGREIGVTESFVTLDALGRSNGSGVVGGSGSTGFSLSDFSAAGSLEGRGEVQFVCGQSLDLTEAQLTMNLGASYAPEMGLVDLIPGLNAAADWPVVGRIIHWITELATVKATLAPDLSITTQFEEQGGQLAFIPSATTGEAGIETSVTLAVEACEDIGASVTGGGRPYVQLKVPDPYLDAAGINLWFAGDIKAYSFEVAAKYGVNCVYGGVCESYSEPEETFASVMQLIPRDYLGQDYAVFRAGAGLNIPFIHAINVATTETTLVSNIYTYPEPDLAVNGSKRLLAYVHDDDAQPQGLGTHIRALYYNGSAWSAPADVILPDSQPDYGPAVALLNDGSGVVVWERSSIATGTLNLDQAFAQSLDVVACEWTGAACSGFTNLSSDPAQMHHAPQLSRTNDGLKVMALWKSNDGSDILGTAAHPIAINYAWWDGANWSAPAQAHTGLYDIIEVASAAYAGNQAALVYVRDMDGDLVATPDDTELWYSAYNGAAWSGPTRLTSDAVPDSAPTLAYDSSGALHLAWLRNGELVWLNNSWEVGNAQAIRPDSLEGGFLDVSLSSAPNGNLAMVWQGMGEAGADLFYRVYDSANGRWAADQTLTEDIAVEAAHSAAFGAADEIFLAYQKITIEPITQTFDISPTLSFTVTQLPVMGQSDLAFAAHTVGHDLTFDRLVIHPSNPTPGSDARLTAVLRNAGDLTALGPQVAFYDDGVQIGGIQTLADLTAGLTTTVQITWTVPITAAVHTISAKADPNAQIVETDEGNNALSLQTVRPDLQADLTTSSFENGALAVTARFSNVGVSANGAAFQVSLRAGDPVAGDLVISETLGVILDAGDTYTITFSITDTASLGSVNKLWVVLDETDAIPESDETNNTDFVLAGILPDLAWTALEIEGNTASVTIANHGPVTTTNALVEARQSSQTGTLLYSATVTSLAPGESQTIEFTLPAGSYAIFVSADPGAAIPERDESNNLLVIDNTTASFIIYLPLVVR